MRKNRHAKGSGKAIMNMGAEARSQRHRKGWKCPQFRCNMSSSRHWNVARHIRRIHNGIGVPFDQDDSLLEIYKEYADQGGILSLPLLAQLSAAWLSPNQKREEHRDFIDRILPYLRKCAEFNNLSGELFPRPRGVPLIPNSLEGFNSAVFGALYRPAFPQGFSINDDELGIVGYIGHTCEICLINHPLALYVRILKKGTEAPRDSQQELLQTIPTTHRCDLQRAINLKALPIETRKDIIVDLRKNLPDRIMTSVKSWTKNQSGLVSFEMRYNVYKNFSLDLFPDDENHWSNRTIKNRQTSFKSDEEMMDFIRSAKSSTAGLFNVHSQSQENGNKSTYFVAIVPFDIP